MGKKTSSAKNSDPADFSWTNNTSFISPENGGDGIEHKKIIAHSSSENDFKQLLEKLLGSLIDAVGASAGVISILAPHGKTLQLAGSFGLPDGLLEAESVACLNCETVLQNSASKTVYTSDLSACLSRQDCRYAGCSIQSMSSAPIESNSEPNKNIGILTVFFNQQQEHAGHIVETVRAYTKILSTIIEYNKSNLDTRRAGLVAERQAIANEIHDSLAQSLMYARMRASLLIESLRTGNQVQSNKYAHDVDEALENSQKTVRELIKDFRCSMDPSGLLHALQTLTGQFCQRNDIALEYSNRVDRLDLPLEYEIQVYHIIQEALANIAAHSGATRAHLTVERSENHYAFTIEDNGSGCSFSLVEGHYGMMIMRERAQRMGGEIQVDSAKGSGTRVQLLFPVPGENWRKMQ